MSFKPSPSSPKLNVADIAFSRAKRLSNFLLRHRPAQLPDAPNVTFGKKGVPSGFSSRPSPMPDLIGGVVYPAFPGEVLWVYTSKIAVTAFVRCLRMVCLGRPIPCFASHPGNVEFFALDRYVGPTVTKKSIVGPDQTIIALIGKDNLFKIPKRLSIRFFGERERVAILPKPPIMGRTKAPSGYQFSTSGDFAYTFGFTTHGPPQQFEARKARRGLTTSAPSACKLQTQVNQQMVA